MWNTVKKYKNTNESQEYKINIQAFKTYYPTLFEQFQKWVKNTSIVPDGEYIKIPLKWLSKFHLQNTSSSQLIALPWKTNNIKVINTESEFDNLPTTITEEQIKENFDIKQTKMDGTCFFWFVCSRFRGNWY
ncbi:hypothetical protein [Spiroplasma endosymbiont of Nebria brevicollis]|uniref:hypothetical protein n=1 Tax=Spiroplasma endosymbiont of Nebria brevicollis TaxID=3066284 RepID=UPI00313AAC4B